MTVDLVTLQPAAIKVALHKAMDAAEGRGNLTVSLFAVAVAVSGLACLEFGSADHLRGGLLGCLLFAAYRVTLYLLAKPRPDVDALFVELVGPAPRLSINSRQEGTVIYHDFTTRDEAADG